MMYYRLIQRPAHSHQTMLSTTTVHHRVRLQPPQHLHRHPLVNHLISVKLIPPLSLSLSGSRILRLSTQHRPILSWGGSRNVVVKCDNSDDALHLDSKVIPQEAKSELTDILSKANSYLPHIVLASTLLALIYPPSFTWFTNRYYAPALGFLMFAVGLNSNEKKFVEAFRRPAAILIGYVGQFVVKPLLGFFFGTIAVTICGLPSPIGAGIMLTSCVSGAQLSNYATFLTDPEMAPLSIVMTSLSTASATFVTPLLSLLLIGKRLPVDVKGMMASITQIVVAPIVTGLLLNRLLPGVSKAIRPFLPPLSVFVTSLCVGAPLAININAVMSPFGLIVLLLIIAFHLSAFVAGYLMSSMAFRDALDAKSLQRTISYETGMQSSLLGLALANKFFEDPIVGVPPAISTVIMSLMGFSLVMLWAKKKQQPSYKQVASESSWALF